MCIRDRSYRFRRVIVFFRVAMAHESLESYFKTNFALMQHHKYSLTELENMMPWEREIYVTLLSQYIEEENLKRGVNGGQ